MSERTVTVEVEMSLEDAFFEEVIDTEQYENYKKATVIEPYSHIDRVRIKPAYDSAYYTEQEFRDINESNWNIVYVTQGKYGTELILERQ